MKKITKILLIALIVVILAAAAFAYANRSWIAVIINGVSNDNETLEKMVEENRKNTDETLKAIGIQEINPLSDDDIRRLKNGEMSEEEAVEKVLGKNAESPQNSQSSEEPSETKPEAPPSENSDLAAKQQAANEKVANLVGNMYVLKARFEGELADLEGWIIGEYEALPKEERTYASKVKLGRKALAKANELEASCDSQVDRILSDMEAVLKDAGMDTSCVDAIRSAYKSEKEITKSYYVSKYK